MKQLTASQAARFYDTSLKEMSEFSGAKTSLLHTWYNRYPLVFRSIAVQTAKVNKLTKEEIK